MVVRSLVCEIVGKIKKLALGKKFGRHVVFEPKNFRDFHFYLEKYRLEYVSLLGR